MNKTDFITKVAELSGLNKKDAEKAVNAYAEAVVYGLETDGKVQLMGHGNYELRDRAARKGRNPQTGEEIQIAAATVPVFKPAKALKEQFK